VLLFTAAGDTIDAVSYGSEGDRNQSLYREGDQFLPHTQSGSLLPFSPGAPTTPEAGDPDANDTVPQPDDTGSTGDPDAGETVPQPDDTGSSGDPDANETVSEPNDTGSAGEIGPFVPLNDSVYIVEILADPPPGLAGDANGDGYRSGLEDEFVEIMNVGLRSVDISGWRIGDNDLSLASMFAFPDSTVMSPGERIVLFWGWSASGHSGCCFC
jgi:hypothetical protein